VLSLAAAGAASSSAVGPAATGNAGSHANADSQQTSKAFASTSGRRGRSWPRHLLKRFDFDERRLGNLEDVPMYWYQKRGAGLPHYNEGRFDWSTGHNGVPSFRLRVITRSVAYTYKGSDITVHRGSQYLIQGWIKTHGLKHARAFMSVRYATREGAAIEGTEVFSRPVGGPGENDRWQKVTLLVPSPPARAKTLQITLWLAQPDLLGKQPATTRPILHQDAYITAWFDDIEVYHLPKASIRTRDSRPAFWPTDTPAILYRIYDPLNLGLAGRILVREVGGPTLLNRPVRPIHGVTVRARQLELKGLKSGVYEATLQIVGRDSVIATHEVRFARLPSLAGKANDRVGIVLDERSIAVPQQTAQAVRALAAGVVQVPIWHKNADETELLEGSRRIEKLFAEILPAGVAIVGVIEDAPKGLAVKFPLNRRGLLDILSSEPARWQPYLAISITRYADVARLWQLGKQQRRDLALDERYLAVAENLDRQISTLVDGATFSVVWPAIESPPRKHIRSKVSLIVPNAVVPREIPAFLKVFAGVSGGRWAYIEPLPIGPFEQSARRADLAKRLVYALASQVEKVFLPQPWQIKDVDGRLTLLPNEDFVVLAALTRALAGKRYAGRFVWHDGAEFHIFEGQDGATLIVWNDRVPSPRKVELLLGENIALYDLQGRPLPITQTDGKQVLTVGSAPIIATGAAGWLARLRSEFRILPQRISSSTRQHQHTLVFVNTSSEPVTGVIRLRSPRGWRITPSRIPISLQPGGRIEKPLEIRLPSNEPVGSKIIYADITVDARKIYRITAPTKLEVTLPGIDAYAFADASGENIVIRQVLTNRTNEEVNFMGFAILPEVGRQERLFTHVQPGQTVIKEYILPRSSLKAGVNRIRLGLREVNGPRLLNQEVQLP